MELRFKMWMEHKGRIVFGRGRAILLEAIAAAGSISAAARRLDMSYRPTPGPWCAPARSVWDAPFSREAREAAAAAERG